MNTDDIETLAVRITLAVSSLEQAKQGSQARADMDEIKATYSGLTSKLSFSDAAKIARIEFVKRVITEALQEKNTVTL